MTAIAHDIGDDACLACLQSFAAEMFADAVMLRRAEPNVDDDAFRGYNWALSMGYAGSLPLARTQMPHLRASQAGQLARAADEQEARRQREQVKKLRWDRQFNEITPSRIRAEQRLAQRHRYLVGRAIMALADLNASAHPLRVRSDAGVQRLMAAVFGQVPA